MLNNVNVTDSFRGLYRTKAQTYITKTVNPLLEETEVAAGWSVAKKNKRSVRLRKPKVLGSLVEDRVWCLLYRMHFTHLSGPGGGSLELDPRDPGGPATQIDVVGIDSEVVLAIECKSAAVPSKRPQFSEELGKHALIRERLANTVRQQFPGTFKRQLALVMFTFNVILSENDKKRAQDANITLFDEQDLVYYEDLVSHLGPAARFQFLADVLPGKTIPGLSIRVPAVRTKMGGYNCYTFSVSPDYLLKISYVSHRAKGKASDVNTYQRMIRKSRLQRLAKYIDDDGIFPTNIVINFDRRPRFERQAQESENDAGVLGWLDVRAAYKSAWIIDGQHRLFAYSGHARAAKARLSVLAFESLPPSKQAQLFIDINAQQKSVKQSLLQELYAELHWNAADPAVRVSAIIAKVIEGLDADPLSPFYRRVLAADEKRDPTHCITLTSIFRALDNPELFIASLKNDLVDYGPFWGGEDGEATRRRTASILNSWFGHITKAVPEWWAAGSGEGGGLAMNDGVTACINVLRSVLQHLAASGEKLVRLDDEDLAERLAIYGNVLGQYFASLSVEERKSFRDLRGVQGQVTRTRRCQQAIHERIPSFIPIGLKEFMDTAKAQTNSRAKAIIDRIERNLQETVLEELRREFGLDESQWWITGVPKSIRIKVTERHENDDGRRGGKEYYFDLLDYRNIILQNWELFGPIFGFGKANSSKDKRTSWIMEVNEWRNVVSHVSAGRSVSLEQLASLEDYDRRLTTQLSGTDTVPSGEVTLD